MAIEARLSRHVSRLPMRIAPFAPHFLHALAALSLSVALAGAGCGPSLPLPRTGPHPANESQYIEVPYPPPPGHVEFVPPRPRDDAVWVDGQWNFEGGRWAWQAGGWVVPPAGAYFAPWTTVRLANGKLLFLPGSWYGSDNRPLPPPPVLASAGQAG